VKGANDPKVKAAREKEMTFHEKVYEDMKEKIKSQEKVTEETPAQNVSTHPEASSSSGAQNVRKMIARIRKGENL